LLQDVVRASDTDVDKSKSSSSLNEAQSQDEKLDTALNIQNVTAVEQAPDIAVKSKRKQLIAERAAAVEFTEVRSHCDSWSVSLYYNELQ
jgi:uncharacterized membrane protein YqiK